MAGHDTVSRTRMHPGARGIAGTIHIDGSDRAFKNPRYESAPAGTATGDSV